MHAELARGFGGALEPTEERSSGATFMDPRAEHDEDFNRGRGSGHGTYLSKGLRHRASTSAFQLSERISPLNAL